MADDLSDRAGESVSSRVPSSSGSVTQTGLTERDIEVIADRVYRLLMSDMRLELARGARAPGNARRES